MKEKIDHLLAEVQSFTAENAETLEQFRIRFLGRKGQLQELFEEFKTLTSEQKRDVGQLLNVLKNAAQEKVNILKETFESEQSAATSDTDLSKPVNFLEAGSRHPLSLVRNEIIRIFSRLGFSANETFLST